MQVNLKEYKQRIQNFSKSTLVLMSNILGKASKEEQIGKMHKIIMETETEEIIAKKLKQFLSTMTEDKV